MIGVKVEYVDKKRNWVTFWLTGSFWQMVRKEMWGLTAIDDEYKSAERQRKPKMKSFKGCSKSDTLSDTSRRQIVKVKSF